MRTAATPRPGLLLERLDSARVGVVLLVLMPVFAIFRQGLTDPDFWWHLEAGRWIVEHGRVPWEDPFSYTARGRLWIAYSWLAEVVFYALTRFLGFDALIWFIAGTAAALVGLVYLSCRTAGASPTASLAVSSLGAAATSGAWAERPQLLSFVLLAALVGCLRSERLAARLPWLTAALVALWVNVHIVFSVGIALVGLAATCDLLEGRRDPRRWAAVASGALATLLNPYGWRLLEHLPLMIGQLGVIRATEELRSPDFHSTLGKVIGVFVLSSIGVLVVSRERKTLFELSSFFIALASGLYMARNMALFAIIAAPTVARHLDSMLPVRDLRPARRTPRGLLVFHGVLALVAIGALVFLAPRKHGWRENLAPGLFPVAAADHVAERYSGRRLFNDFDWGGFLIFRLYPGTLVSIDGRNQVYGEEILRRYLQTHFLGRGWEQFLLDCDPDVILWPADSPFAILVGKLPEWRQVFADETAVVFVRAGRA
jgi:hypothetical protein